MWSSEVCTYTSCTEILRFDGPVRHVLLLAMMTFHVLFFSCITLHTEL